ncbi:MAG: glycosyltransferase family 4 protein [Holosporales bacterium]|jgi:glycosyltransferase involved in cell wall biosynthesis|nr:glycosyltransferase family 4 protein [Holosporales bacterium]
MRLLFTIPTLRQGGSERVISILTELLSERHDVAVAVQDRRENCFYHLTSTVKQIHTNSLKKNILSMIRLRKVIKGFRPDIIVSFLMQQNVITLSASYGLGIPLILSERTSKEFYSSFKQKILSRFGFYLYRFADLLVVQTAKINAQFKDMKDRVHVIVNPIKLPDKTCYCKRREKLITAIGRLDKNKNHRLLIQSFSRISNDFSDWKVEILGEGPEKNALQKQINDLGLRDRVRLCGLTEDVFSVLDKSSIFAMPSRFEGLPNALCEAMLAELPVIYSNISGADELINPGETGLLVKSNDDGQFAESMGTLIQNQDLREKLGKNAKKHIIENFSAEKIVKQWERLFFNLLKNKSVKST